jgi:hypothetical protein
MVAHGAFRPRLHQKRLVEAGKRGVSSPSPIRDIGAIPLPSAMGGPPDITDADIPDPILELPNVPHIHPAPIVADLNFVMGTDFDPTAPVLKGVHGTGIKHPFPDPFALMGPQGNGDLVLPVIDNFQEPTGFIAVGFRMQGTLLIGKGGPPLRQLYLNLCKNKQGSEAQDGSYNTDPSKLFQ